MRTLTLLISICWFAAGGSASDGTGVWSDPSGDAVVRLTDGGANGPVPSGLEPIDLVEVRLRGWAPSSPSSDPYTGSEESGDADIVRLDVILAGLVAPPGPLGLGGFSYDPYRFGSRPLFGYIELDVDAQKNSGGELTPLAQNRYLANVGRFGLSPLGSISERMVRQSSDVDADFFSPPEFERTGGEFSLALCGCFAPVIVSQSGDSDGMFDAGETWVVRGRFFERFQSFGSESALFGALEFGQWNPLVDLRFSHSLATDQTTVTLVTAITNGGAGDLAGQPEQGLDLSLINHTSMFEALDDLIVGADFATGPVGELADPWRGRSLDDYQRPRDWDVNALIGTAYTVAQPDALFVWTDTGFSETYADLDDDDLSTGADAGVVESAILTLDGTANDGDGLEDGAVTILGFGIGFDVRDLTGDGVIDLEDRWEIVCPADLAAPFGTLNFFDLGSFLSQFNQQSQLVDFLEDNQWNFLDLSEFLQAFNSAECQSPS